MYAKTPQAREWGTPFIINWGGSRLAKVRSAFCAHFLSYKEPNGIKKLTSPIFIQKQTKISPTEVSSEVSTHLEPLL